MVAQNEHPSSTKRALVVQRDPQTRKQICEQLIDRGFHVDACATLAEARASYRTQTLVVANTERDPSTPKGFIAWIRDQHAGEDDAQPYVLAVSDREASMRTPPPNRAWDELLTTPLNSSELKTRIAAIETWVNHRIVTPVSDASTPSRVGEQPQPSSLITPRQATTPVQSSPQSQIPKVKVRPKFANQGVPQVGKLAVPAPKQTGVQPKQPIQVVPDEEPPQPSASEQFQALIDHLPKATAMLDRDLRFRAVNQRWLQDFGLEGNLEGTNFDEVFPRLRETWGAAHQRALQGMPTACERDTWVRADGTQHELTWEVQPWINGEK